MTALLELKQRIKNLYSQYEIYILPVLRFVLAMVYFIWINTNMGYMKQIDNIFIVLILALICSILPSGVMIFVGFALMVAHGYALGIEVAGFMLVLILFMAILLMVSVQKNKVVLMTAIKKEKTKSKGLFELKTLNNRNCSSLEIKLTKKI